MVNPVNREIREIFPDPSAAFVFSNDGEIFYILGDDGVLRAFDSHDGEQIEAVQVLEPFERVFGSPSPAMTVAGEWLFLSAPYSGRVSEFISSTWRSRGMADRRCAGELDVRRTGR